jgi:hypothetical protein
MFDIENAETHTVLPVCINSNLIRMKIKDIESEFKIKVKYIHNPRIAADTRDDNPLPDKIIELGMGIGVEGIHKNVDKLFTFAFE